jgi:PAS domain S-box-containing protein
MCPAEGPERPEQPSADSLQHSEERFRLLVDSVKDYAIFMLDLSGHIMTWNVGAERIKGYPASEVIGRHFSVFYPEADVRAGKCELELAAVLRDGRFEDEGMRVRKDGSLFWANVVLTTLHDDQGRPCGIAKVTRDLTERRRAEDERLRLAQEREASRIKDEFLAMISHELRTPLMAILGWSTLLGSRISDPQALKALETIRRNAQAQARIIDDILDLSDVVSGKLHIDLQPIDLSDVVREALAIAKPLADAKRLTIVDDIPARVPMLGDSPRLQHVTWNILSNAIKFTGLGGLIEVSLAQTNAQVLLRVRDTGRGIDPAFLPHVFERFRQADPSSTRTVGGLGLGLSLVRSIAQLHGGEVAVHSDGIGRGTTIEVTLPAGYARPGKRDAPSQPPAAVRPLEGLRVLVVDDEPDARELLSVLLARNGAAVDVADSAAQAREILSSTQPHVLLSDIGMPDEDGYDLMRSVRALPGEQGGTTPAIALTAYTRAEDRRRAFAAGFNDHLPKPVDPQALVRLIRGLSRDPEPANA